MRKLKIYVFALTIIILANCAKEDNDDDQNLLLLLFLTQSSGCNLVAGSATFSIPKTVFTGTNTEIRTTNPAGGPSYYGVLQAKGLRAGDVLRFTTTASTFSVGPYSAKSGTDCDIEFTATTTPTGVTVSNSSSSAGPTTATITTAGDYNFLILKGVSGEVSVTK
ncbi:hypothetical protein [Leptospira sp. GIMC2001]|uniref:hypothetical protein n=1 Tax=Leptospira sp. GIMC2001 TaxID=1513297 RepID=UPI00234BFC0C|nr:hypothetical protein [Leptospira sp. GIMC2001]WCL48853.1 hypothetical protein O4O04_16335 [Leptospira sp. GIMC2001]